jgi:hypothetical protein
VSMTNSSDRVDGHLEEMNSSLETLINVSINVSRLMSRLVARKPPAPCSHPRSAMSINFQRHEGGSKLRLDEQNHKIALFNHEESWSC